MRTTWPKYIAALGFVITSACDGGTRLGGVGDPCSADSECSTDECFFGVCVQSCFTNADCSPDVGEQCGPDGLCGDSCGPERASDSSGSVCIGGVWTSCESLDGSYCDLCDGRCPGQRCVAEVGCAPLSALGEDCLEDSDCNTNNCSLVAGVCRVPLGSECDATNCDLCMSNGTWSSCSRECGVGYRDCPGDRCLGDRDYDYYTCRPSCDDCSAGRCATSTDGSIRFCSEGTNDWTLSEPPREELQPCLNDGQCAEGSCLSAPSCGSGGGACYGRRGFCSGACTTNADCGEDGRCVQIPCIGGATTGCGNVCLPSCDPGTFGSCNPLAAARCRSLPSAEGGEVAVCDPRKDDGAICFNGSHCVSGTCSGASRCVPAGGSPNGTSCANDSDCASGNCQASTCRGTALRGDACEDSYDCSVGTCTGGTCD